MDNLAYRLIENYEKNPKKVCLIQGKRKVTYEDLYKKVANFKYYLDDIGIKKMQKVLILVPMSIELYVTLLAVWAIGAIPCFMDAGFIKNGMKNNDFDDINALIGIKKYILYANINKNLKKLNLKIDSSIIENLRFKEKLEICDIDKLSSGILTYTSGTTGKPKIAARTHEFLAEQGNILRQTVNYEETDIEISTIPIFTLSNINAGITTVIADANFSKLVKSNPKKIVNQMKENNVNRVMCAPRIIASYNGLLCSK